jgi:hypothetical protein
MGIGPIGLFSDNYEAFKSIYLGSPSAPASIITIPTDLNRVQGVKKVEPSTPRPETEVNQAETSYQTVGNFNDQLLSQEIAANQLKEIHNSYRRIIAGQTYRRQSA